MTFCWHLNNQQALVVHIDVVAIVAVSLNVFVYMLNFLKTRWKMLLLFDFLLSKNNVNDNNGNDVDDSDNSNMIVNE